MEIPENFEAYQQEIPEFESLEDRLQYLSQKIHYKISDGKVVGKHQGAHYFTIGQRKGLAVGGTVEPLFVIGTDVEENVIYTGQGKQHPGLLRKALFISNEDLHWVREDMALSLQETLELNVRIRYRQPLQKAKLYKVESGLYVEFEHPQPAITSGQFAAWYLDDELVGSGVIS